MEIINYKCVCGAETEIAGTEVEVPAVINLGFTAGSTVEDSTVEFKCNSCKQSSSLFLKTKSNPELNMVDTKQW